MTNVSPRLKIDYLLASQADKHVAVNSALSILDKVVQLSVLSRDVAVPPTNPLEGDCYIVATGANGIWTQHVAEIAIWRDDDWRFTMPLKGWCASLSNEARLITFDGTTWVDIKVRSADRLGINASSDLTNRLAVSSESSLFNHDGADHRLKVNKADAGATASVLFQNNYVGRAEVGLLGNDRFGVKVSHTGVNFKSALTVDPDAGYMGIWTDSPKAPLHIVRAGEGVVHDRIDNSPSGVGITSRKARGSVDALMSVQTGDSLAAFGTAGYDGATFVAAGFFRWVIDGNISLGSIPTRLEFYTAHEIGGQVERMRITKDGFVGFGVTAPTCRLHVLGAMRIEPVVKAALPHPANCGPGSIVFVSDEIGGAVLAFSDGSAWRRVTDRAIVS